MFFSKVIKKFLEEEFWKEVLYEFIYLVFVFNIKNKVRFF